MSHEYTIKIEVEINARYADAREAHTDADSIATHVTEECGNIVDDVRVVSVEPNEVVA